MGERILQQILAYFESPYRVSFTVPLKPVGTIFQQRVWRQMSKIPPGQVQTYGELATSLHTSARAVGNACRANPIPLIIPCHRVVAKHSLGGYAGRTNGRLLDMKQWLLEHEQPSLTGNANRFNTA